MFLDWRLKKHCGRCKQYRPVEGGRQSPGKPFLCADCKPAAAAALAVKVAAAQASLRGNGADGHAPRDPDENWITIPAHPVEAMKLDGEEHYRDQPLMTTSALIISEHRCATPLRDGPELGEPMARLSAHTPRTKRQGDDGSVYLSRAGALHAAAQLRSIFGWSDDEARKAEQELGEAR